MRKASRLNSVELSETGRSPTRTSWRDRLKLTSPTATASARGETVLRRSTALTRAASSRGLNGLGT